MTEPAQRSEHLLLYEPRTEGHHLGWLRFITEDLLTANVQLTLAVDRRAEHEAKIRDHLGELLSEVTLINARVGRNQAATVANCLRESGAANVFLCAFDEIASGCWRRACLGVFPPTTLKGRMSGIYHRPRFLSFPAGSFKRFFKQTGFQRVLKGNWLRQLLFVDEYLTRDLQIEFPGAPIHFLPDPCPPFGVIDQESARRELGVPADKRIFLFYGGGYRRKGLHLAVRAMLDLPPSTPAYLLCMGQFNPTGETAQGLDELIHQGRAKLVNRYVSTAEEKLGFAACDVVLLPYLHHFGTSGVLSRAMSAGRMVIVSDEELLGRLTRDHGLGLLFPTDDAGALRDHIRDAANFSPGQFAAYSEKAKAYAAIYSRDAYRRALTRAILGAPPQS